MLESKLLPHLDGYIGGKWTGGAGALAVINPANGEILAEVPDMGEGETENAVEAAAACLDEPASLEKRRSWVRALGAAIRENREELGRIITLENGKPIVEGEGEADYAAGFFEHTAEHMDILEPRRLKERPRDHAWTVYSRPAGVAALITPWNFPLAMVAKKLSGALAAGCPSVIKPSEKTPLTMIALFTLLERVGLPPGMCNLVTGMPKPIGKVLCEHPAVRVISFTGSTGVGKHLIAAGAGTVKRMALELGGNAPFIVFADADLELAADHLMQNKFRAGGQTCVCANRILVESPAAETFAAAVSKRVKTLVVGDGLERKTSVGPMIDADGMEKVRRHLADAVDKGAKVVAEASAPDVEAARFFSPTVLRGITGEMACTREETFGPLVPIMEFESEERAVSLANDTEYGLAAYLFCGNRERAERVISRLRFGHVGRNTGTGPTPEAPFGGMKQSGIGREGGHEGILEFVELQTVPES